MIATAAVLTLSRRRLPGVVARRSTPARAGLPRRLAHLQQRTGAGRFGAASEALRRSGSAEVTSERAKQVFGQRHERGCKRVTIGQSSGGAYGHETPGRTRRTEELRQTRNREPSDIP